MAAEIIPNLWIGDINSANDTKFLCENNVTVIINCTVKYGWCKLPYPVTRIRVPINDRGIQEDFDMMYTYMNKVIPVIYLYLSAGRTVLIHCYAGRHRSVCIVLGFIMKYAEMDLQEAIDALQNKWPRVGMNFLHSLSKYSVNLHKAPVEAKTPEI